MTRQKLNDGNGRLPAMHRFEDAAICRFCGTRILWARLAHARIPYEAGFSLTDHRTLCRLRRRGDYTVLGIDQHRFATVRRPSARLMAAAGRAGKRPRPWKAMTGRSSRDELVAHVPVTQAAGLTTGRAGAQATAPLSTPRIAR